MFVFSNVVQPPLKINSISGSGKIKRQTAQDPLLPYLYFMFKWIICQNLKRILILVLPKIFSDLKKVSKRPKLVIFSKNIRVSWDNFERIFWLSGVHSYHGGIIIGLNCVKNFNFDLLADLIDHNDGWSGDDELRIRYWNLKNPKMHN